MTIQKSEASVPDSLAAYRQPDAGPSSALQRFNADGAAAMSIAVNLADTPFVPTSYKKRGERWLERQEIAANVAAAWLAGEEIGLRPMQALQAIDIIEGRPALNALAQRALVQAHGHEIWVHERVSDARGQRTQVSVTVRGKRKGTERIAESTWSLDRARQAGLLSKKNWQNHPEAMCFARASSDVCRQIAADVLLGLAYTSEELQDEADMVDAHAGDHKVALRPAAEPEPEQKAVEAAPAEPDQPTVEEIDAAGEQFVERQPEPEEDPNVCTQVKPDDPTRACSREKDHPGRHFYGRTVEPVPEPEPEPIKDPETTEPVLDPGLNDPETDEEDTPFDEPSDEDLDRAYEEEQRARAAAAAAQPAPVEDEDPWADFEENE